MKLDFIENLLFVIFFFKVVDFRTPILIYYIGILSCHWIGKIKIPSVIKNIYGIYLFTWTYKELN